MVALLSLSITVLQSQFIQYVTDYQLSAHMSHTVGYLESNRPLQPYILSFPFSFPHPTWSLTDLPCCPPHHPCHSHPHHPPCHPHTPPPPCHHPCCLLPSLLHTLPHPCCFTCVPLLQMLVPPCEVSLQPINELAGLVLKWEALL